MITLLITWGLFGLVSVYTCWSFVGRPVKSDNIMSDAFYYTLMGVLHTAAFFSGPIFTIMVFIACIIQYESHKNLIDIYIYEFKKIYFKTCSRKALPLYINKEWETQELEDIFKRRLYGTKKDKV